MQSEAAMRQVTAETWPFLQMDHGNVDGTSAMPRIYLSLSNAGVGPARVRSFRIFHEGWEIREFDTFLYSCCAPEGVSREAFVQQRVKEGVHTITDTVPPIIPDGASIDLFTFPYKKEWSKDSIWPAVWKKMDDIRWELTAEACYCSLLGDCFRSNLADDPVEVKSCEIAASNRRDD